MTRVGAVVGVAAICAALAGQTVPGAAAANWVHDFFEYYSGVFSLVALSVTVMGGIAATERGLFRAHQRVQLQIVHRAMAFTSVMFLAAHIALKVMEAHASALDAVIPFAGSHRTLPIGLGTIASYLMVTVLWTGVARARFAGNARPWLWRALHSSAYLAWPIALGHGLEAGRAAKPWVVASYGACLALVSAAHVVRLCGWLIRRGGAPKARRVQTLRGATMSPAVPSTAVPLATVPLATGPSTVVAPSAVPLAVVPPAAVPPTAVPPRFVPPTVVPPTVVPATGANGAAHAASGPLQSGRPPESPPQARPTAKPRTTRGPIQPAHPRIPARPGPAHVTLSADASDEEFWAFIRGEALR